MHLSLLQFSVLLLFFSSPAINSSQLPTNLSLQKSSNASFSDYGGIFHDSPIALFEPKSTEEISLLLKTIYSSPIYDGITVSPRGAGHSAYGQAQAPGGIVIDMQSFPHSFTIVKEHNGPDGTAAYVDASGGALWIDVLKETLKHGLAPRSWTDYLYLTVGGTLSVGGLGGQAFKYGPQISNVVELDVVTGKGEIFTCSEKQNSELYYGVLGGLGQFGIITRARIMLQPAPKMVTRVRVQYDEFDQFLRDGELAISKGRVDYLEGFVKFHDERQPHQSQEVSSRLSVERGIKARESNAYYLLEMALYHDDFEAEKRLDEVMGGLCRRRGSVEMAQVSLFEFLNRVRAEEMRLRERGLWDVAHPWINLLVPREQTRRFIDLLLETIGGTHMDGPIIIYPTLRHKWSSKTSFVLPQLDESDGDGMFYAISVLRAAPSTCTPGSSCLAILLQQNQNIIIAATASGHASYEASSCMLTNLMSSALKSYWIHEASVEVCIQGGGGGGGMGAKQYMPWLCDEMEWRKHFGEQWKRFQQLKAKFDPLHVLTPGQRIFYRKPWKHLHVETNT